MEIVRVGLIFRTIFLSLHRFPLLGCVPAARDMQDYSRKSQALEVDDHLHSIYCFSQKHIMKNKCFLKK